MKYRFHPEARFELLESISYYEGCQEGLGGRFFDAIDQAVQKVVRYPDRWRKFDGDVRRCLVRVFPYVLLYTIESDSVLIVAVMHCSREPGYWKDRIPPEAKGGGL